MEGITNIQRWSLARRDDEQQFHNSNANNGIAGTATNSISAVGDDKLQSDDRDATLKGTSNADVPSQIDKLSIDEASKLAEEPSHIMTTHPIIHEFLMGRSPEFRKASFWKKKGWASAEGDIYFMMQRERADHADMKTRMIFYHMMGDIAEAMDQQSGFLRELKALDGNPQVLDICMAPGGFTGAVLRYSRHAEVFGISLPVELGGHPMIMSGWESNKRLRTLWLDITLLANEMGATDIPTNHPDFSNFSSCRPWYGQQFDLIFCDGAVLRTHLRATYRDNKEPKRLQTSQLIIAMQRIKPGGTLICRLHKIEAVETASILQMFDSFSSMQVFKPPRAHVTRSSFYMIAKNVQPQSLGALRTLDKWKSTWAEATLGIQSIGEPNSFSNDDPARIQEAKEIVQNFGLRLIDLATPVWKIQGDALENKDFITGNKFERTIKQTHSTKTPSKTFTQIPCTQLSSGTWMRGDPRSTIASSTLDHKDTSPTSAAKNTRHIASRYTRNPFMAGDPRSPGKSPSGGFHSTSSDLSGDGGHKLTNRVESNGFFPASGVPFDSRFWGSDPRTSEANEFSDSWRKTPSQEDGPFTTTIGRRVVASNRVTSTAIGIPGGSLVNTNIKPYLSHLAKKSNQAESNVCSTNQSRSINKNNVEDAGHPLGTAPDPQGQSSSY